MSTSEWPKWVSEMDGRDPLLKATKVFSTHDGTVVCRACKKVIFGRISRFYFNTITKKEAIHLMSKSHKQAMLLWKLAGDEEIF